VVKRVVVLGSGAAARYVSHIFSFDADIEIAGFTTLEESQWGGEIHGIPILGSDDVLADLYADGVRHAVIGIGTPQIRSKLRHIILASNMELTQAIHPSVIFTPDAQFGDGVVVEGGCVMNCPTVADNVWIGLAAMVSHDNFIGIDSQIGGGANIGMESLIGERVLVGMGATICAGRKVGDDAVIGSGANVVHDVPAGAVVVGNPGKVISYRCEGGA
jgi:sugar O-acyltransferase (sialic acid O-acetyltransferase NeuD family)